MPARPVRPWGTASVLAAGLSGCTVAAVGGAAIPVPGAGRPVVATPEAAARPQEGGGRAGASGGRKEGAHRLLADGGTRGRL